MMNESGRSGVPVERNEEWDKSLSAFGDPFKMFSLYVLRGVQEAILRTLCAYKRLFLMKRNNRAMERLLETHVSCRFVPFKYRPNRPRPRIMDGIKCSYV